MSTSYDYKDAKARYINHKCNKACLNPCLVKRRLFKAMLDVISKWGLETGDDTRQATQHYERIKYNG